MSHFAGFIISRWQDVTLPIYTQCVNTSKNPLKRGVLSVLVSVRDTFVPGAQTQSSTYWCLALGSLAPKCQRPKFIKFYHDFRYFFLILRRFCDIISSNKRSMASKKSFISGISKSLVALMAFELVIRSLFFLTDRGRTAKIAHTERALLGGAILAVRPLSHPTCI